MKLEKRFTRGISVDAGVLSGVAIRYGETATIGGNMRERFERGAFGESAGARADVILNLHHDRRRPIARTGDGGNLTLEDSSDALRVTATDLTMGDGAAAVAMIKRGILRGLSVEFVTERERRAADGERVIERARLMGVAVVDRPAYEGAIVSARATSGGGGDAVELRAKGQGVTGLIAFDTDYIIRDRWRLRDSFAAGGRGRRDRVRKQRIRPGAFDDSIADADNEIMLTMGRGYDRPLASKFANTLALTTDNNALRFDAPVIPEAASYVKDFRAAMESGAASYGAYPMMRLSTRDGAREIIPEADNAGVNIEVINEASLHGIAIVARAPKGNPGAVDVAARRAAAMRWR